MIIIDKRTGFFLVCTELNYIFKLFWILHSLVWAKKENINNWILKSKWQCIEHRLKKSSTKLMFASHVLFLMAKITTSYIAGFICWSLSFFKVFSCLRCWLTTFVTPYCPVVYHKLLQTSSADNNWWYQSCKLCQLTTFAHINTNWSFKRCHLALPVVIFWHKGSNW